MKYYVYVFLRKDRYSPYYVGKGCGVRCFQTGGRCVNKPPRDRIVKIKENLTEEESFELERTLIKFWGRKDEGGILYNTTDGGEGTCGWNPPSHWRENRSKIMTENNPFRGKTHTQEVREHLSKEKKGRVWVTNGSTDMMVFPTDIPDGYHRGRTKQNNPNPMNTLGMFWVTNGTDTKMVREVPKGYWKGRTL